jgi:hypothetical protein
MIKGITQTGRYMMISGGTPGSTYVNNYSGSQGVGNMRYNTTNQSVEVYDGNIWIQLSMSYASVGLTGEAESLLDWAREKRNKEIELTALANKHPAVAKALENLNKAQEQLDLIAILSKDYENNAETTS